ncbi:MFS transporter [Nocardioides sambongensis]|uniref:MFS transporter n=1 Tax=Nocardioides sambongensis TaxID=2589074 RepID=UPI0018C8BC9E|nr:MFS transporter [Nocardioides sambongensis]
MPSLSVEPLGARPLRRVVAALCVTQIVSWGVLFYAFPVMATSISESQDWPLTTVVAVFTVSQLVAAVAGIAVGHLLDRNGPRRLMTVGSAVAVVALVVIATAPSLPIFLLGWVCAGVAMSATLYPPAFATITHWAPAEHRVRALTALTLVAGFASTVFAPLAAVLDGHTDWRTTYLVLAGVLAGTVPLHWRALDAPWRTRRDDPRAATSPAGRAPARAGGTWEVVRQPRYVGLVAAFTLGGFCVYAVVINLVPLLTEHGLTTTEAAVALGIGGVGQVGGRLLYAPVIAKMPVEPRTVVVLLAAGATTAAIALSADWLVVVGVASFAAGIARGIFTLIQATAVTDRWGRSPTGPATRCSPAA